MATTKRITDSTALYQDLALGVEKASLINVEIFDESNERLASLARFTTCAMASFDFCYFQNDQWKNNHLDTLYTNFIRYPSLLHASSPPAAYIDQLRWRLNNKGRLSDGMAWYS